MLTSPSFCTADEKGATEKNTVEEITTAEPKTAVEAQPTTDEKPAETPAEGTPEAAQGTPEANATEENAPDESATDNKSSPAGPEAPASKQGKEHYRPFPPDLSHAPRPTSWPNPREMLAATGYSESYFRNLLDDFPVAPDEVEALLRLMYVVRAKFHPEEYEGWGHRVWDPDRVVDDIAGNRGTIWRLRGYVERIVVHEPIPELIERFEFKRYYQCDLVLGEGEHKLHATVYTSTIPKAWDPGKESERSLHERCSAYGFFFKFGVPQDERPAGIFVAPRIAWHSDSTLGDLGMDVGLFDDVDRRTRIRLENRECFYQMLSAVGAAGVGRVHVHANQVHELTELFGQTKSHQGALDSFKGIARRITRVELGAGDQDIRDRFGMDHYFQIDMMIILESPVRVGDKVLERFPLIYCCRRLPEGMPQGESVNENVQVAGFFFTIYAFEAGDVQKSSRMEAPLLIGKNLVWIKPPISDRSNGFAMIAAGVLCGTTLLAVIAVWLSNRGDEKFSKQVISKQHQPEPGQNLNELGLTTTELDLSNLP